LCRWTGNVRELENFVERYVLLFEEEKKVESLAKALLAENFSTDVFLEKEEYSLQDPNILQVRLGTMEEIELQILVQLVQKYKMDKNEVARLLGISRTTLWKKLKYTPVGEY
jgi:DNA-binding NtrC family response regulator